MWKNIVEPERPQTKIWRMRCACWLPKATNTHSEYVILTAFPLQQWLHESAWMLRCRFNICLVSKIILAHQAANLWPLLWPPLSFPCYQFVGIWPHLKPNRLHIFHLPNSFLRSAGNQVRRQRVRVRRKSLSSRADRLKIFTVHRRGWLLVAEWLGWIRKKL